MNEEENKKKLFVGGLPWSMRGKELREFFEAGGFEVINATVILEKETKRSRGFGFVELTSEEDALAAVDKFHKYELDGRWLQVNIAEPRKPREA